MNRMLLGYSPDLDLFDDAAPTPTALRATARVARKAVVVDAECAEQAAELLEVTTPAALGAWLTRRLRRAARASGHTLDAAVEAELVNLLQPVLGFALQAAHPARTGVAERAGRFFGIELEGLSAEDQEFEIARRFVQLTSTAARCAALAPAPMRPAAAARHAAAQAAKRHAPGWLAATARRRSFSVAAPPSHPFARAGRWPRPGPGVIALNP